MSRLNSRLCNSLTYVYIIKLNEKNIITTTDFVSCNPEELVQLTGIPFKAIVASRNVILAKYASLPVSGADLYHSLVSSVSILSTGAQGIDDILGGGLYMGELTEIVGDIAAGKTQLCFSASVTTAVDSKGHVIYIDTGGVFSAQRLQEMMYHKGVTKVEDPLCRIQCYHAFTLFEVFSAIEEIRERRKKNEDRFYRDVKLIVVDNVASVLYPVMGGDSYTEYQAFISQLGHMLKSLATEYPCAVLVTNNYVKGDNKTRVPSLGRVWSHVPHVRIGVDEIPELSTLPRRVTVLKNCRGPTGVQSHFQITDSGHVK